MSRDFLSRYKIEFHFFFSLMLKISERKYMALICEETCEQVPSSWAKFTLCRCASRYNGPDDGSPQIYYYFWCDCPHFLASRLAWYGMTVEDKRFTSTPKDACKHVKIAWRATLIAKEYWKNYKLAQSQGWGARFAQPDKLSGEMRAGVVVDEKLNDDVDGMGIGKINFIPTRGEIEKYNITTHYTVKTCGNNLSCTCLGFIYHKNCKHVYTIIQREKMFLNRRELAISLALLHFA